MWSSPTSSERASSRDFRRAANTNMLDWAALTRLVPEIAIVVVFVWFTLERDKLDRTSRKERDERDLTARTERDKDWRDFLSTQRGAFTDSLTTLQAGHREGMARLAEEVKAMSVLQSGMNALLVAHDQSARAAIEKVMRSE